MLDNDEKEELEIELGNSVKEEFKEEFKEESREVSKEEGKAPTLEERFDRLEELIGRMESEELSLDESFALYKEGLNQIQAANEMLDSVEKAMLALNENGELEEFA